MAVSKRARSAAAHAAPCASAGRDQDRQAPRQERFAIVGIGASAGGLDAFTQLLKHVPADTGMGFVLVQHLDPAHESALAQLLAKVTAMPVCEATHNLPVEPNHVYVMPSNRGMTIAQGRLKLQPRQQMGAHRSIDVFLESLAKDQRERAIAVILSGTASDGTMGTEAIKAEGGITFAQDQSAKYESMPRSAIGADCIDFVFAPEQIAAELSRIARHPFVAPGALPSGAAEGDEAVGTADASLSWGASGRAGDTGAAGLTAILALLYDHAGVDFSFYKPGTIQRRIARRMVLNRLTDLDGYAHCLRGNAEELGLLYTDLLISVTGFFRNPEAFEVLKQDVFPALVSEGEGDPLRVWVLGCSSGQEAYSLAMAFAEFADHVPHAPKLQLFATDLNGDLLAKARSGLYAKSLVADLSPERIQRFFTEEPGGYRICKPIREAVVFAKQNLLGDPPFSRMNLISCRNVLIYVDDDGQNKALRTFHYALKPKGFLLLGAAESIGPAADLFEAVDKKAKLYRRKDGLSAVLAMRRRPQHPAETPGPHAGAISRDPERFHAEFNVQREADRITLNRFAPTSVLVNSQLQALQFRGDTSLYLRPPTGLASLNVLKMARDGLMLPLRTILTRAKQENAVVRAEHVRIDRNGGGRAWMNMEVVPLNNLKEPCYLVFFEEAKDGGSAARSTPSAKPAGDRGGPRPGQSTVKAMSRRIAELETDLAATRDYLQSVQQENEVANEELQASNEEVTSANEELQSLNEELETSKEELESSNEELTTVNEEMITRNADLQRLTDDMVNLQTSTRLAIVLLGRDLVVRGFSPQAEQVFNLYATDVGRPIGHVRHKLDGIDLEPFVANVITTMREHEREVCDHEGRWYSLRARPYMVLNNRVDGAVLVLVDIDALKRTEQAVADAREEAEAIIRTVPDALVILNADLTVHMANDAFYRTFKMSLTKTKGRALFELGSGSWDIPQLRPLLADMLLRNSFFNNVEVTHTFEGIGRRTVLFNARVLNEPSSGNPRKLLMGIQDITEVLAFQAEVRRSELRYRRLFEAAQTGVLLLNPVSRTILDANPFAAALLGYSREALLGKELHEVGLLADRAACEAALGRLKVQGPGHHENAIVPTKTGARRSVEFVSNRYREDNEEIIQCTILDITPPEAEPGTP